MKIHKDDNVLVVTGKDRGKKGKVRFAYPKEQRVIVEGINMIKKHSKARGAVQQAGIIDLEAPIHISNVMLVCSKCNKCVEACPEKVIVRSNGKDGGTDGTPMLRPNHGACTLCGECMEVCPTGALKKTPVGEIRIGIAVVEPDTCLGYLGKTCRVCHDACPLEPNAIDFDATVPKVDSRICTGCGLCVHDCPTKPSSIVVLPRPKRSAK